MTSPKKILIITPAPRGSRKGNRISAERWARLLRELGHDARVREHWDGRRCDAAFVLHARRCADDLREVRQRCPRAAIILCLTGTDLYDDIHHDERARESLFIADALLVLQELAVRQLPPELHSRVHVVHQSVTPPASLPGKSVRHTDICVVGHVREVKDPLRAALAARELPPSSSVRVLLAGGVIEPHWQARIRREAASNPRFQYLGELPAAGAQRLIARSHALVVSSRLEGGANVISEACVLGTPILASRMDGNVGLLGPDYPGLFEVGDTGGLAALMRRLEVDPAFTARLAARCRKLAPRFSPARERQALKKLLAAAARQAGRR
jgi:putative glycosyltransferase (TIGR04348 family)